MYRYGYDDSNGHSQTTTKKPHHTPLPQKPGALFCFVHSPGKIAQVHERLLSFFGGFKSDAHPMAIMVGVVGALSAFYPDSVNIHDPAQVLLMYCTRNTM